MPVTAANFSKRLSEVSLNENEDNYVIDYDYEDAASHRWWILQSDPSAALNLTSSKSTHFIYYVIVSVRVTLYFIG